MFNQTKEPFDGDIHQRATKVASFFANTLPNIVYSQDSNFPAEELTQTVGVQAAPQRPVIENVRIQNGINVDLLESRQAACEGSGGIDQFQHLTNLANSQDPYSRVRCGWMYNTQKPLNGRGAYGVSDGPFKTAAQGNWMWDLKEAKKKMHMHLCSQVKDCKDIDAFPYNGRCGWCSTSGRAVPIENGRVAYPLEPNLACGADALSTGGNGCPAPPVQIPGAETVNRQVCDPMNGRLTRDCLVSKVKQAGCSDAGTLAQALRSGSDTNYIDVLRQSQAFGIYQQRAATAMDTNALQRGNLDTARALTEFMRVSDQAASGANSGLAYAARDLCVRAGEIDKFDFCTEILDTTRPPFALNCLQNIFLRMGGQRTGTMYPQASNINSEWNTQDNWGAVKRKITALKESTKNTNRATQEPAMMAFYGIPLEDKTQPLMAQMPGCEIFWFTHQWDVSQPTMFLGRRIRNTLPDINQSVDLKARNGGPSPQEMISFVYMCNLSVDSDKQIRVRATGDDGYAHTLNRPMTNMFNGKVVKDANELTNLNYFPPTTTTNDSTCWALSATKNNLLYGYWFQGGGGLYYKFEYQDNCNTGVPWKAVPASMINLIQEPYAPMCAFEVGKNPENFGADFNFFDKRLSSYKMKFFADMAAPLFNFSNGAINNRFPHGKGSMTLRPGMGVTSRFRFKMHSFQTMTLCCIFNDVPGSKAGVSANMHIWSGWPTCQMRIYGTGDYKTGELRLLNGGPHGHVQEAAGNLIVETGVPYLIVIKTLRRNDLDIYSQYAIQIGCGKIEDLKKNGAALKETEPMVFNYPKEFDDPDDNEQRMISLRGDSSWDLHWIHMFDYKMDAATIQREALQNWQSLYGSAMKKRGPPPCYDYGQPSADNNIRVYTKEECDKLDGNWHANGECIKKGGGSYSWDCRTLNFRKEE